LIHCKPSEIVFQLTGINCVLDVGAHKGEYRDALREVAYRDRIVPFDPLPPISRIWRPVRAQMQTGTFERSPWVQQMAPWRSIFTAARYSTRSLHRATMRNLDLEQPWNVPVLKWWKFGAWIRF
jgi:hypothetical protein